MKISWESPFSKPCGCGFDDKPKWFFHHWKGYEITNEGVVCSGFRILGLTVRYW